ncbi:LacI family DNA-binding transcriptional regulator [Kiritimatiellota bacterium B12222]|nr:LacI family DNA-binding transcriptional regulator [Kiritimatiellota bacterium B12222]
MNKKKHTSIRDVAEAAGVSVATVSRVMNKGPVSEHNRANVLKAIADTGYQPDTAAASLRKTRVKKIGVVIPDIGNPAYALTVKVAHEVLKARGYYLILGNTYGNSEDENEVLQMMMRERVSGVLYSTCEGDCNPQAFEIFKTLINRGVIPVFIGRDSHDLPVDTISVNNSEGITKLVDYLVRIGRKKIGFVSGGGCMKVSMERLDGFKTAMQKNNLTPVRELCEGPFSLEGGETLGERMLHDGTVDAMVCGNDMMAIGVMRAAKRMGLRVPQDLCVTGFDNINLATLVSPSLTTVHQPFDKIITRACTLMIDRIEGRLTEPHRDIQIDPEIVVRESA